MEVLGDDQVEIVPTKVLNYIVSSDHETVDRKLGDHNGTIIPTLSTVNLNLSLVYEIQENIGVMQKKSEALKKMNEQDGSAHAIVLKNSGVN